MSKKKQCCYEYDGEIEVVKMESGKHYGKETCKYCHKFIKWAKNPKITAENNERNLLIDKIIQKEIPDKIKNFLINIKDSRFLTPPQNNYYKTVMAKYNI